MSYRVNYLPIFAFGILGIVWGCNFIYTKLAAEFISPLQIVFFRILFGFLPVFAFALSKKTLSWRHLKHSGHFLMMALLAAIFYYYSFAKGTSLLLSGVAGVVSGAIPLFSFLLALIFIKEEKASWPKLIGVVIGFAGVALIGTPAQNDLSAVNLIGVLYMIAGSLSVGSSFVYARKYIIPLKIPATALTAYQLGLGLIIMLIFTDYHGITNLFQSVYATAGAIIGMGLLGTGVAYILYYYILEEFGVITASSATYIPPVVALLIGAGIVGEKIALLEYVATCLIFGGVFLLRKRQ